MSIISFVNVCHAYFTFKLHQKRVKYEFQYESMLTFLHPYLNDNLVRDILAYGHA